MGDLRFPCTSPRWASTILGAEVGSRVQGSGFRVQGLGFRVQGAGFRVQGLGFRVQGLGFRVSFNPITYCLVGKAHKTIGHWG